MRRALTASALLALGCPGYFSEDVRVAPAPSPERVEPNAEIDSDLAAALAATGGFQRGEPRPIAADPRGEELFFLRSGPRSRTAGLYAHRIDTGEERSLIPAEELAAADGAPPPSAPARLEIDRRGERILLAAGGRAYLAHRSGGRALELSSQGAMAMASLSPDGDEVAFVRGSEVRVMDTHAQKERVVYEASSKIATGAGGGSSPADGATPVHELRWSPGGEHLALIYTDRAPLEDIEPRAIEPSATHPAASVPAPDVTREDELAGDGPQSTGQASNGSRLVPYARAGAPLPRSDLVILPLSDGEPTRLNRDRETYPYIVGAAWDHDGGSVLALLQTRRQDELAAIRVGTGGSESRVRSEGRLLAEGRVLFRERASPYLAPPPQGAPPSLYPLPGGRVLRLSFHAGDDRRLELRDPDGALARNLTPDGLTLRAIAAVDASGREAYVTGVRDGHPTEPRLFRVPIAEGGEPTPIAPERPGRAVFTFPDADLAVFEARARPAARARYDIIRGGEPAGRLRSRAEAPPRLPGPAREHIRAGEREIRADLYRPRDREPGRAYPAIVHAGAAPFGPAPREPEFQLKAQWLADHGYAVIAVHGLAPGTDGFSARARGDSAHDVALADARAALTRLAARHPEIDDGAAGLFGTGYGGYLAAAAASRGGPFRAAAAISPVTDFRDHAARASERYLGLPRERPDVYARSSLPARAHPSWSPLLLVHGERDPRINPRHSLALADALEAAGADHEIVTYPHPARVFGAPEASADILERVAAHFAAHLGRPD